MFAFISAKRNNNENYENLYRNLIKKKLKISNVVNSKHTKKERGKNKI